MPTSMESIRDIPNNSHISPNIQNDNEKLWHTLPWQARHLWRWNRCITRKRRVRKTREITSKLEDNTSSRRGSVMKWTHNVLTLHGVCTSSSQIGKERILFVTKAFLPSFSISCSIHVPSWYEKLWNDSRDFLIIDTCCCSSRMFCLLSVTIVYIQKSFTRSHELWLRNISLAWQTTVEHVTESQQRYCYLKKGNAVASLRSNVFVMIT